MRHDVLTKEERQGKQTLTTYLALVVGVDLGIALLTIGSGTGSWLSRVIRIMLTILLCAWVYRGSRNAKWLAVILFGAGGLFSAGLVAVTKDPLITGVLIALSGLFLTVAVVLVGSRNVNAFLEYQQRRSAGLRDLANPREMVARAGSHCPMCGATLESGAVKCPTCGENPPGTGDAVNVRLTRSRSSRRAVLISFVVFVPIVALVVRGYRRDMRAYTKITITYAHAPARLVEAQISLPVEIAVAGSPGLYDIDSFCRSGRAELFLTWDPMYDPEKLKERLARVAEELPRDAGAPVVETVTEAPAAKPEKDLALIASVEPNMHELRRHRIDEQSVWNSAMSVYSESDDVAEQYARLNQVRIRTDRADVLLTDVATVELVEVPICVIRRNGSRLK